LGFGTLEGSFMNSFVGASGEVVGSFQMLET
jgi:hypothetical protein